MSTEIRRTQEDNFGPTDSSMDEGYWDALLAEGEFAQSINPDEIVSALIESNDTKTNNNENSVENFPPQSTEQYADWDEIARIMQADEVLNLKVIGYNRGGLLVEWRSLRGFVPASQLVSFPGVESNIDRREALVDRVGDSLRLRVIELDPEKNRLILSERAAQVEAGTRDNLFETLSTGDKTSGKITNLTDFGAFVDLGGVEGLIHISELSWGRVGHPADMLSKNQEIEVYVLEVNPDQSRIALSIKRLNPDPWATVETRYKVGELVDGQITNVVDFGAFACIEEGLEGLIHFSELAEGHFLHPRNVVQEGDAVTARILTIDGKARRLGLSLRLK